MSVDPFPQQLPTLQRLDVDEPAVASATDVAAVWLDAFSTAIASSNVTGILDLFLDDGFWKDTLALTWDFRTIEGREAIKNLLDHRLVPTGFVDLRLSHEPFQAPELQKMFPDLVLLRLCFEFGTKVGKGTGVIYLVPAPGSKWKAYTVYTCLHSLNDFPEQVRADVVVVECYYADSECRSVLSAGELPNMALGKRDGVEKLISLMVIQP